MSVHELGRVPRIVAGEDALTELVGAVEALGCGAVLIVDEAVALTGYAARVAAVLRDMPVVQHIVPAGEPTVASVDAAADVVRDLPGAVVIGIGGGSALDTAKQAAVVAMADGSVAQYVLCAVPFAGRRAIIAIPTTSGTGAEVTRTCILSDAEGRKLWTWGDEMLPDLVLLDPTAAATMPSHVTAATGLDAFVHALEAISGQRRNVLSVAPAAHAMRLVVQNLPTAVSDGANLVARQRMQEAALLAGTAIDNCGTGMAHSIGHALGSLYHLPHGASVAIGLDAAIDWNVEGAPDAYADAGAAFGGSSADVPLALRELFESSRFPEVMRRFPDIDLVAADIAEMMVATENQPMFANNSRTADDADRMMLAELTVQSWKRFRS
ncbi:MAG: putative oxidoreductase (iron-containing alcohol dehydrogenase family) [Ilumatobacteraceae bacterium]|nr:putative oxidoreductase (iron-containing alcohol dehydrogenase family) [Ilumatobacteraceae bacterium]